MINDLISQALDDRWFFSLLTAVALGALFTAIFDWRHGLVAVVVSLATRWGVEWRKQRKARRQA